MYIAIWILVLLVSLYVLVRGSRFFIEGAKELGATLGMSTFAIGVVIVGFGTSLPEFAAAIAAVLGGATEIVVANSVGSNITNILLIAGILAAVGGKIVIQRDLIKGELPIFFIATTHFLLSAYDGYVDRIEAILLLGTFTAYVWYLFYEASGEDKIKMTNAGRRPRFDARGFFLLGGGLVAVLVGAKYSIDAVVIIATALAVPVEIITIGAIAFGTSLPELFVSIEAIKTKQSELAIANIFGSNAFNILAVVGASGLFAELVVGDVVVVLGLPIFVAASAIFFVSGLSRQIMRWEGMMMVLFFAFFIVKLIAFI